MPTVHLAGVLAMQVGILQRKSQKFMKKTITVRAGYGHLVRSPTPRYQCTYPGNEIKAVPIVLLSCSNKVAIHIEDGM